MRKQEKIKCLLNYKYLGSLRNKVNCPMCGKAVAKDKLYLCEECGSYGCSNCVPGIYLKRYAYDRYRKKMSYYGKGKKQPCARCRNYDKYIQRHTMDLELDFGEESKP